MLKIRLFRPKDTPQIAQLFYDTVRTVNIKDYSIAQVKVWATDDIYFRNWTEICSNRFTYVAEKQGLIVGFGELEANGHIDCFYCHKDYQRCGIGSEIYRMIEVKAKELKLNLLFTEVSITAKPFFESMGFVIVCEQKVSCQGEIFTNYRMEKNLAN